jgi:NADH-quinone oxidoreductase subunit F
VTTDVNPAFRPIREEALRRRHEEFKEAALPKIHIGMATCGIASGALETRNAFEEALAKARLDRRYSMTWDVMGHCYAEPVVVVENPGFPPILYYKVTPGKARMIVKILPGRTVIPFLSTFWALWKKTTSSPRSWTFQGLIRNKGW